LLNSESMVRAGIGCAETRVPACSSSGACVFV
jgi:hypothetical protein